jgi:hypothetical protein
MAIIGARSGRFPVALFVLAAALTLGGCGASSDPVEPARPVLVTHPAADSSVQAGAFAGDVHARE